MPLFWSGYLWRWPKRVRGMSHGIGGWKQPGSQKVKSRKKYVVGFQNAQATNLIPTLATLQGFHPRWSRLIRMRSKSSWSHPDHFYLAMLDMFLRRSVPVLIDSLVDQLSDEEIATFVHTTLEASDPYANPNQRLQWNNLMAARLFTFSEY